MAIRSDLRQRLEALECRLISPIEYRVAQLQPNWRERYHAWKREHAEWQRQCDAPTGLYEALLNEKDGPRLPFYVADKLFNRPSEITENMTFEDAREAYREFMERGQ